MRIPPLQPALMVLAALLLFAPPAPAGEKITVLLDWFVNPDHAPLIVAREKGYFADAGLDPWQVMTLMVLVWFLLGMIVDSISIMLLTVPIFAPIATAMGMDPLAYALIGILAIEAGMGRRTKVHALGDGA